MTHLNRILEVAGLTLGLLVLVGILTTDAYSRAAQVEANGDATLMHLIANDTNSAQLTPATATAPVVGTPRVVSQ